MNLRTSALLLVSLIFLINTANCLAQMPGDQLWSIAAPSWKQPTSILSTGPLVTNGKFVIFGTEAKIKTGYLNAIDINTGKPAWVCETIGECLSGICIRKNEVFVVTEKSYLYCIDAGTGNIKWKNEIGYTKGDLSVRNNDIYLTTRSKLLKIDARNGKIRGEYPGVLSKVSVIGTRTLGKDNNYLYCIDNQTGKKRWTHNLKGIAYNYTTNGNHIWLAGQAGEIQCVNLSRGNLVWEEKLKFSLQPFIIQHKKTVVILTRYDDCRLIGFDIRNGKQKWELQLPLITLSPNHAFLAHGGQVIFKFGTEFHSVDAETGKELWSIPTNSQESAQVIWEDRLIIKSNIRGTIKAIYIGSAQPGGWPQLEGGPERGNYNRFE